MDTKDHAGRLRIASGIVAATSLVLGGALAAQPALADETPAATAHSAVAYKSQGSGYDKDQVLTVDGQPFWYSGIQLRADKLLTQIGYRAEVPLEENDPSDPDSRSLEQIFKQVAEDGYNTVNVQVLWSDLQKDKVTTAEQTQSATLAADGSPADTTVLQTGYQAADPASQQLGYLRFDVPDDVTNVDGAKVRLYVNSSDPRQLEFPGTGGMYFSHYLKLYDVPSDQDVADLTWGSTGLGDFSYDGTDLRQEDGSVVEPASVLPKWDPVKRSYFYDVDVSDAVADAVSQDRDSVSFLVASSTPADRSDRAAVAAETISFETASSTLDDSATNTNYLKQPLRPRLFFSDARMESIDWTYYDTLVRYAEKYGLKFEVIWFGSDSTGLASDYRVPFYVFHQYQMTTVDQDPTNVLYNGSVGTPLFQKKIGDPNQMYVFLGDKADTALMQKEGDMLQAIVDHTAGLTNESGANIASTLIGVQTQNEPHNGRLNGSPIKDISTNDGLGTSRFSRSALSLAQRDLWRAQGDADHGGYKVATDAEFTRYQMWYYNDYLAKRVKESALPVWTRVNHENGAPATIVDPNEQMRVMPGVGTYLDFVGIDTYRLSVSDMYKIGNGAFSFNIDKGDNLPMVMEDGMNNTTAAEKKFATVAGGAVHNGYNACSFDGDALYDSFTTTDACGRTNRPADATTGTGTPGTMTFAQKIARVALVNKLYSKVGYDLATRNADIAGGSTLRFVNAAGSTAAGGTVETAIRSMPVTYAVAADPDGLNVPSRGFAIERSSHEIALGTTETTTFRLGGLGDGFTSVELGTYDADASDDDVTNSNGITDNTWTKQADAQVAVDGDDLVVTVPAGDVARVVTAADIPPAPAEYRYEAERSNPTSNTTFETWNDGASAGGWNKLLATGAGDYLEYTIDVPTGGQFELSTVYRTGTTRGVAQVTVDGQAVGAPYDLYASTSTFPNVDVGTVSFTEPGTHTIRYTVTGKNATSTGYQLGVDVMTLREIPPTVTLTADGAVDGRITLAAGTTTRATAELDGGLPEGATFVWQSSDSQVVSVSETGDATGTRTIEARAAGTAVIVVSPSDRPWISASLEVTVEAAADTQRPEVTLVSPATAGPFPEVRVQVDAADDGGLDRIVANIYRDGTLVKSTQTRVGGATTASHTATVLLPDGNYSVRYNAHDLAGNVSKTGTFAVTVDATAPTVTVKPGDQFTVGAEGIFDVVSYKLYDAGKIDKVIINGVVKDLTDNAWSDVNFLRPGTFGAVQGANTMVVHDVAGNTTTVDFTLG